MSGASFDVEAFYVALDAHRRAHVREFGGRYSWRAVGRELGISHMTFTRLGLGGRSLDANTLVKLLVWLGETDVKPYIRDEEAGAR